MGKGTKMCGRMAGTEGDTARNGQGLPWCCQSMVFTQPGEFQEAFGLPEASLSTLCSRTPTLPGPGELSSPCSHSHSKGVSRGTHPGGMELQRQSSTRAPAPSGHRFECLGVRDPQDGRTSTENIPREYISLHCRMLLCSL